ncbi:MAG: hypothetical protein ACOWWR_10220 [Eubacteriales bacterium]
MVDIAALLLKLDVDNIMAEGKEKTNWIWIHRKVFKEILSIADEHQQLSDYDMDTFLRMVTDDDFIELIQHPLLNKGFMLIDEDMFTLMENKRQTPLKAYIFIKEAYFNRLLIKGFNDYEWVLKAMAIDYSKYMDKDLAETYKEFFEGNTRIIEQLFKDKKYAADNQFWFMDFKYNLLSYQFKRKQVQWSKEEAESKFSDYIQGV